MPPSCYKPVAAISDSDVDVNAAVGYHRDPPTADSEVDTPNIDSLVEQGLELNHHYAASVCAPSRSSLLSGRLPIHVNDENRNMGLYNPDDPVSGYMGIPIGMTTLGTKMKEAGADPENLRGRWLTGWLPIVNHIGAKGVAG